MEQYRDVIRQFLWVSLFEIICIALMYVVYAIIGLFTKQVLIGGLLGGLLAIGNFFVLSIAVCSATDRAVESGDSSKAALAIRSSSTLRLLCIGVILFFAFRAGICDPIAALVPLILLRISMAIVGFFFKEDKKCK